MANEVDLYNPRTLHKVVSRTPPVKTFFKSTFFKNLKTFPTESVDVDYKKGGRQIAPFVHPKIGGKTVEGTGYTTKTYTPPLVAPDTITTADQLMKRLAGETMYSGKSPAERAVIKLAEDIRMLDEMTVRREEWMCAQALLTGKIPIIGEGLHEEIDFQFTNYEGADTAAAKWQSDKLGYVDERKELIQETGYINPDFCLVSKDVAASLINDSKIQKLLDIKAYDLAVIKPRELPNGVTYIGTLHGKGLDIYTLTDWYLDDWTDPENPITKPIMPNGLMVLLSTKAEYSMYYGAITQADDNATWHTYEGTRVPNSWVEHRPDRRFLQLSSRPLPVPHEVDSWSVSQVIAQN